jgi:alpha-D-ribose 1-methylphosphonate 5-triphosphate synthase subunit PhnH
LPPVDDTFRDPVRAAQHIFRVALDALANPGALQPGLIHPAVARDLPKGNPWLASLLLTVLDHEVAAHVAPGPDAEAIAEYLVRRVRPSIVPAGEADFVAAAAETIEPGLPEMLRRGGLEYPDDGATLVIDVPSLQNGLALTLTGPGIKETRTLRAGGLPAAFFRSRDRAVADYPMGIDLLLVDRCGRIAGLPRTTRISIEAEGDR